MFSRILIKKLSEKSKIIVDDLSKNFLDIFNLSISEYAKKMHVHPSFITKTLKKVGYKGWKDWVTSISNIHSIKSDKSRYGKYINDSLIKSINQTLKNIDKIKMNILIQKMDNNKINPRFIFTGNGYSLYICRDQARRYNRINKHSDYIDEKTGAIHSIESNSIIFVVSISGVTSLTDKELKYLKETKKATLILISGVAPIKTRIFDFIFHGSLIDNKEIIENQAPTNSRILIYLILDMIFTNIYNKNIELNNKLLEMLREH